ncbi:MAG TPA: hypothetical protein VGG23_05370, partial [Acidimicrobiales bacterium]
ALLAETATRAGKQVTGSGSFEAARQQRIDAVADAIDAHLDRAALDDLVASGRYPAAAQPSPT